MLLCKIESQAFFLKKKKSKTELQAQYEHTKQKNLNNAQ